MSNADWSAIRSEYEQGEKTLRQLAASNSVSKTAIIEHRNREKWTLPTTKRPTMNTQGVIREMQRHITHDVKELRDEELYRLEQLQARAYKEGTNEANEDWTWATDRYVALSKRKSELMGMDVKPDDAIAANTIVIREVPIGLLEAKQ